MTRNPVVASIVTPGGEGAMRALIAAARRGQLTDEDVAELADTLAASGAILGRSERGADIASTGGPSSLSTLLCPLHLRCAGLVVPTLGVPGRPAGGIDVLQTIPGFDAVLDPERAERALARFGLIHLLADKRWAPLDADLFAYRHREGAQAVPALVIASLLAKKLASGAVGAGLEIRVAPHGNFGVDRPGARANATRFRAVAELLGLRALCFLTDGTHPYQPYVGRGEALLAIRSIVSGDATGWLAEHDLACAEMTRALAGVMNCRQPDADGSMTVREAFEMLLSAHGTGWSEFEERVDEIGTAPRVEIRADRAGAVRYDLGRLRDLLVARQLADQGVGSRPPDPAGVILHVRAGDRVGVGEPLMSVRVPTGEGELATELGACAEVAPTAAPSAVGTLEII